MKIFPKIKLTPKLLKFAYRFIDVEASSATANPDQRIIEYAYVINSLFKLQPGKVLDVGCTSSINYLPSTLTGLGWKVWGIDLREFKFEHPDFHSVIGDITNTDFPDDYFDVVFAISTIEHIGLSGRYGIEADDPDGDVRAVQEIARILKPGGSFLCTVPFSDQARVVTSLQRTYDDPSLKKLFTGWQIKNEAVYYRRDDGYWIRYEEGSGADLENPDGESVLALLELSPDQ